MIKTNQLSTFLYFFLFIHFLGLTKHVSSQTIVPGGAVSGKWTKIGSPYLVKGPLQISNGTTLIIEPGVIINFQGSYKLMVQGQLLAIGTKTDSITFTATDTTTGWKGIRFDNTPSTNDTSQLIFCKIQYAKYSGAYPNDLGGALCMYNYSKIIVSNCYITRNYSLNGGGIYCHNYTNSLSPIITKNLITYNNANEGGGIYISLATSCHMDLSYNIISNNTATNGGGLMYDGYGITFSNNLICNNSATNGGGIKGYYSSEIYLLNNTIVNNKAENGGAFNLGTDGSPNIRNCIIWGNTASISGSQFFLAAETADPDLSFNDIQGGSADFGLNGNIFTGKYQNNISSNPVFKSPSSGSGSGYTSLSADWSLQNTSPCIDKGDPTNPYYPLDLTGNTRVTVCRIDMGAFEKQTNKPLTVFIELSKPVQCNGTPTGEIKAIVTGGTKPYSYSWNTKDTSATITGLTPGEYTVTVSESGYGCSVTNKIFLTDPPKLFIEAGLDQTIRCGNTAQLELKPSWIMQNNITDEGFGSVNFPSPDTGYVVSAGRILKTTDAGIAWNFLPIYNPFNITNSFFNNGSTGYIVGEWGNIMKTIDGGNSWNSLSSGTNKFLYSITFTDLNTGYIACDAGMILKTINGGTNWVVQNTGVTDRLCSVFFSDKDTGYAVGYNGVIIKTTNGGSKWIKQTSGTTSYLTSVFFINGQIGFAVGQNGCILKTINGGLDWIQISSDSTSILNSVFFVSKEVGYIAGNDGTILKTINGGKSWSAQPSGTSTTLSSICFINANTGFIVGWLGTILKAPITPDTYSWSPTEGLSAIDIANPIANPNTTKTYYVEATIKGCKVRDSVSVFVNNYTANAGNDKTIICGESVQLDSVTTNYTGIGQLKYKWAPSTGLKRDTIPAPSSSTINNITYTVTVTSSNGCTATDDISVIVNPLTVDAGIDKSIVCGGSALINQVVSNFNGSGKLKYKWAPSSELNNDTLQFPTATIIQNTNFFVTVTTPNGCHTNDSLTVFVSPLIAEAGEDKTIICGGIAQLDNVFSNYTGNGTLKYHWSPSTVLNNDTIQNPTVFINKAGKFIVTVSTPNGCKGIDSVHVLVNPLSVDAGSDQTAICGGLTSISNLKTNYTGSGKLSYKWTPATGLNNDSIPNPISSASEITYTVKISSPDGCIATDKLYIHLTNMKNPDICVVTVDTATGKNMIVWERTQKNSIRGYNIYKETNVSGEYLLIGNVPADKLSVFVDTSSRPMVHSDRYKISIVDTCGLETALSSPHRTLHLSVSKNSMGNGYNLDWQDSYEGFTFYTYYILRKSSGVVFEKIDAIQNTLTSYSDPTNIAGQILYAVAAVKPGDPCNPTGTKSKGIFPVDFKGASFSNLDGFGLDGLNEQSFSSILVFPNPAQNILNIYLNENLKIDVIELQNCIGESVWMKRNIFLNNNLQSIDLNELSAGVYFLKIQMQDKSLVTKVIKQ